MHCLVHAQGFDVRPLQHRRALPGHLLRIVERREADEFRLRGGFEPRQQVREREPHPGNDHRPGLDTPEAVDPLLERMRLDHVLEREPAFDLGFAVDRDGPGRGVQGAGVACGVVLVGPELVEVVVAGDLGELVGSFAHGQLRVARVLKPARCRTGRRRRGIGGSQQRARAARQGAREEGPAAQKDFARRDFRRGDPWKANGHDVHPGAG